MVENEPKAQVISFCNHRSGVGKTSCVANIGAALAREGKKTLVIDLDPQANLTRSLISEDLANTLYEAFQQKTSFASSVFCILENFFICPSKLEMARIESTSLTNVGKEHLLKELLEGELANYDYILIDCPPSLGLLTWNALVTSNKVIIPLTPDSLATEGIETIMSTIDEVKKRLNKNLSLGGIILNKISKRKQSNLDIAQTIEDYYPGTLFSSRISDCSKISEAAKNQKDVFRQNGKSNGQLDFGALTKEFLLKFETQKELIHG